MPNTDSRLIDALVATVRANEDKEFKAFLPEEETFDELAPSATTKDIMEETDDLQMPEFVKNSLRKKGRENVKMPYLIKKMLEKAGKLPKSKEKGFSFKLDPLSVLFFLKKSFDFLKNFKFSWSSRCFLNHFLFLTKVLRFSIPLITKKRTVPTTRKLITALKNLPYVTPFHASSADVLYLRSFKAGFNRVEWWYH